MWPRGQARAWPLDFVSQPDVRRDRIFACDISTSKFPQADGQDANRITFFQHDVTQPFPNDMVDLLNMTYVGSALTLQGRKSALHNLCVTC